MRIVLLSIALLSVAMGAWCADLTLVKDGTALSAIYVAPQVMAADAKEHELLRASVNDLAAYLGKMSGATIPIKFGLPAKDDPTIPILIGTLAEQVYGSPTKQSPYKQGWRMVVKSRGVGLYGESDEATSYAIYELLDQLGCRWFVPGEMGESIPAVKTITVKKIDRAAVPPTALRNIWYADAEYKRRNRLGGVPVSAGHALEIAGYVSKEDLAQHPDWNAEINGKRSVNGRFCWASTELATAIAENIIARLDKQYVPSISLAPQDGSVFCQCEKCKALDAGDWDDSMACVSITDRYINFVNKIADRVSQKYPDVTLGILAYVQYTRPPVREKVHPSIVPMIAPITYCRPHSMLNANCPSRQSVRAVLEGWGKVSKRVAYYEYAFNLAEVSAPNPMITKWSQDLAIAYKNNMVFWTPETMPNFESVLPGLYLGMRLSLNPSARPQAILDDLYTRFYGAAAEPMRAYWETIDAAWTNTPEHAGCDFGYLRIFTPAVMRAARVALNAAAAACQTDMERQRVELANASFSQFEIYMKMRRNLANGRLATLATDLDRWTQNQMTLSETYSKESAFTKTAWAPKTVAVVYMNAFNQATYADASRIANEYALLATPLVKWKFQLDKEKIGSNFGWNTVACNDDAWQVTDIAMDTWSDLKIEGYYGQIWYRRPIHVPSVPAGKRIYLWISRVDGTCQVYVNGKPAMTTNAKGEMVSSFSGFSHPVSFDVTDLVICNAANQVTIQASRDSLNEIGSGGVMGPVYLYWEK